MKEDTEKAYEAAVAAAVARGEVPEEKTADVDGKPAENDTVLPVARVKRIIKLDKDVKQALSLIHISEPTRPERMSYGVVGV